MSVYEKEGYEKKTNEETRMDEMERTLSGALRALCMLAI